MTSISVIKPVPPKDLRAEISYFIKNASKPQECDMFELTRKALALLQALPSSRDAIFEYFGTIFDQSTFNHMLEIENRGKQPLSSSSLSSQHPLDNSLLDEVHNELHSFISSQPLGWAVIVSNWCFELLGKLSAQYSSRGRSPVNGSLNDSLHQWLTCKATRTLIDLNINCLKHLIGSEESDGCIDVLLDTCVKHSPHFDWAVAFIGTRFPEAVISRVLRCGLQDYITKKLNTNLPKFQSIIGILMHLSGSYQDVIEQSMLTLFKDSLNVPKVIEERDLVIDKLSTVPYLLQLSSLTSVLLSALVQVVIEAFKTPIYGKMERFGEEWSQCAGSRQSLFDLLIHLILSVTERADQIFFLILDATTDSNPTIASVAEEVLELLIKEIEIAIKGNASKVPFLESIQKNIEDIFPLLLSENKSHINAVSSMISFIGQQQPSILPQCVAYVLLRSKDDEHLASVVKLSLGYKSSNVLSPAITYALKEREVEDKSRIWDNITKLVKWEASGTLISLPILEAVYDNLLIISNLLCDENDISIAHTITELIRKPISEYRKQPHFVLSKSVIQATITYFYKCLVYSEGIEEMKGLRAVNLILKKICQESGSRRIFALREILEGALFRKPSVLFGAMPHFSPPLIESTISLMEENMKQGHTALMGQRHSSIFHAGIIGNGKRKASPSCPTSYEDIIHNTNLLLSVLKACCTGESNEESRDAVVSVALLLVELISPDVMYNGLPWPEEDFCKVTVERDLSIRRILDNVPVVWSLLAFIAHHRPALCYCSVILRAVIATLLGQWFAESQQGHGPGHNKALVYTTVKILQIMALGQLLPPPLTALGDVIPYVLPIHVVQILRDCVWNYMRDNVPSPALFTRDANGNMWRDTSTSRPPKQYTETLRLIMLSNLPSLGSLFHTLFVEESS
ncbi:integrator complex subunit 5 [Cimex lectularius]|uniref:Integrator complex subunit 5 n=1 Tax=Cimex lectularius TaxID=79782 RepID=A0A8I6TG03_CIMLE|nr:integrator complex subunit 5 [Cimex lectularius]